VKEVKNWRIAIWSLHGGLLNPIKTIMVEDDLTKYEMDFVALQEVQSKEEKIQALGKTIVSVCKLTQGHHGKCFSCVQVLSGPKGRRSGAINAYTLPHGIF
jgi:hypothetical protein